MKFDMFMYKLDASGTNQIWCTAKTDFYSILHIELNHFELYRQLVDHIFEGKN